MAEAAQHSRARDLQSYCTNGNSAASAASRKRNVFMYTIIRVIPSVGFAS